MFSGGTPAGQIRSMCGLEGSEVEVVRQADMTSWEAPFSPVQVHLSSLSRSPAPSPTRQHTDLCVCGWVVVWVGGTGVGVRRGDGAVHVGDDREAEGGGAHAREPPPPDPVQRLHP
eukprot:361869-Rhodomonas_salina.1